MTELELKKHLPLVEPELLREIIVEGTVQQISAGVTILDQDAYVKMVPIVLEGLVKGFTRYEDKELLLYYIHPNESCVMSFSAGVNNEKSKINAVTIEDSTVLLLPSDKVQKWVKYFPNFNKIFYNQYNVRYNDLLDTIHHLIFDKLDVRLYDYLKGKAALKEEDVILITHQRIANELGTAREVISRLLKKLEKERKIELIDKGIKVVL